MVKKRMAMKMVTIFVALIVCGMFFPGLARGEDQNLDAVLTEGGDTKLSVELGNVVLGNTKTTSVGITNQSMTSTYYVTLLLNPGAACTSEFTYNGPNSVANFQPGDSLDVEVTYTPSAPGACDAALQITYYGSAGGLVEINFNGIGIEEPSETFIEIGGFDTGVKDRPMNDEYNAPTVGEMIAECEATAYNRGQLIRSVSQLTWELRNEGRMTKIEIRRLRKFALMVEIRKIMEARKTSKRSGRSNGWCWWRHRRR